MAKTRFFPCEKNLLIDFSSTKDTWCLKCRADLSCYDQFPPPHTPVYKGEDEKYSSPGVFCTRGKTLMTRRKWSPELRWPIIQRAVEAVEISNATSKCTKKRRSFVRAISTGTLAQELFEKLVLMTQWMEYSILIRGIWKCNSSKAWIWKWKQKVANLRSFLIGKGRFER